MEFASWGNNWNCKLKCKLQIEKLRDSPRDGRRCDDGGDLRRDSFALVCNLQFAISICNPHFFTAFQALLTGFARRLGPGFSGAAPFLAASRIDGVARDSIVLRIDASTFCVAGSCEALSL